jgi:hypothetical protein
MGARCYDDHLASDVLHARPVLAIEVRLEAARKQIKGLLASSCRSALTSVLIKYAMFAALRVVASSTE